MSDDGAYWPSPWPGEDGGPRRLQMPHGVAGPRVQRGAALDVTSRALFGATMVVLREPGEVYVHTFAPGGTTSTVERVDPASLTTVRASPDLAAGPWWPGGVAVHANGDLYVTELFAFNLATIAPGSKTPTSGQFISCPTAVEISNGDVYVAHDGLCGPDPGSIVKLG